MTSIFVDLKSFIRQLRRSPGFMVVVLLMLTLGAGADALMFSVAYSVLLRPLPYPQGNRLVQLNSVTPAGELGSVSWLNFQDWRAQNQSFTEMSAYIVQNSSLQLNHGDNTRIVTVNTTANLLSMLGVRPQLGRVFRSDEDQPDKPCLVILSAPLWSSQFDSDPSIVGKNIRLDDAQYLVVGVMPKGFSFPNGNDSGLWTPLHPVITSRGSGYLTVMGQLKPGVTLPQARSELTIIGQRLSDAYPQENKGLGIKGTLYHDVVTGDVSTALWALIGAVILVQLIICANVGNMQLARAIGRKREIAIRIAMGAGKWRIARQLFTESFALALLGSAAGLAIAYEALHVLKNLAANVLPRVKEIQLYPQVCLALLATAALTAILFGLVPVLQTGEKDLETTLRENGRGINGGRGRTWMRDVLVIGQLGLAVILLFGSVVLLHSLYRLLDQDIGFSSQQVLTMRASITGDGYNGRNLATSLYAPQLDRIRQLPGVESVGLVTFLPLSLGHTTANFMIVGRENGDPQHPPQAALNCASEDYFRVLKISLARGRFFSESDGPTSPRVAIVNDVLSQRYFGKKDPIGQQIAFGDPDFIAHPLTIVGVVHGSRQRALTELSEPEIYFDLRQVPPNTLWTQILLRNVMSYVVRTNSSNPESLNNSIQGAIHEVDSKETMFDIQSMDDVVSRFVQDRRLGLILLGIFAVIALLVAAVGLYAMLSYNVQQRRPEIAVRMAMGARRADVLRLIAGRAFLLNAIGLAAGIVGAITSGQVLSGLLYGVQTWDPVTLFATCGVLALITLPATLIPAYRAASVDMLHTLRIE